MLEASRVAVVVPSPAVSEVLVATSRTICAPMFWKRSPRSISLATVTPSLVMVGAPYDFSSTTLRPLGPRVTATASERILTPRRICSRAAWWKAISLAAIFRPPLNRKRAQCRQLLPPVKAFEAAHAPSRPRPARRRHRRSFRKGDCRRARSQARQPAGHAGHEVLRDEQAGRIARGGHRRRGEERRPLAARRAGAEEDRQEAEARPAGLS